MQTMLGNSERGGILAACGWTSKEGGITKESILILNIARRRERGGKMWGLTLTALSAGQDQTTGGGGRNL